MREDRTENQKCNQSGCESPGAYRFTWPGRDEAVICKEHAPELRGLAEAISLHLQLIPLAAGADADWEAARKHLAKVVGQYVEIGAPGRPALALVLNPLVERLGGGERTQELYDEIMGCE